jgi:hypothetical protein
MRRTALLLAGIALLGGCDEAPTTTTDATAGIQPRAAAASAASGAVEQQGLAALRAATARFHRFDVAKAAGYTFLFMNMCMVDESAASLGGMGEHYVNLGLLDDKVDIATPEAVLYEPGPNGQRRLVAVEYVIPKGAWDSADPPELLGQKFTLNAFDLWALHVWVWKHNPSGMYDSWNPRVTCDHADAASAVAHR